MPVHFGRQKRKSPYIKPCIRGEYLSVVRIWLPRNESIAKAAVQLGQFDAITVDSNRDGPLERIDRSFLNLGGFAPASEWEELSTSAVSSQEAAHDV